ncbi:MAG: hypothetical protein OQL28_13505 [Sedimenticola sp.]|nr:hypothetical protein [Sedimenticola sp.]
MFGEDWLTAQRQFWERLSAASSSGEADAEAESAASAAVDPWQAVLDQWWRQLQPDTPLLVREMLERMLAQGRQLFQLAELFTRAGQEESETFDWDGAIQKTFSDLRGIIAGITGSMNPVPEAMLSEQVTENSEAYLKRLFDLPGLSLGHRGQAQQRELVRRMLDYQRARRAYERLFLDLGQTAVRRLQKEVSEMDGRNERIGSAQQLYALWSSTCESVYTEQAMSESYVRLYAELINSQMAVKQQMRIMMDDALRLIGMPGSRDFRNLEQRAHQDRQSIKALQEALARAESAVRGDFPASPPRKGGKASKRRGGKGATG